METEIEARRACRHMLKLAIDGGLGGFKMRVWENLGWHCCLTSSHCSIHYDEYSDRYDAYMSNDGLGSYAEWTAHRSFTSPAKAFHAALDKARAHTAQRAKLVADIEKHVKYKCI